MKKFFELLLCAALLSVAGSGIPAYADAAYAPVSGTVKNMKGDPVPNATVVLTATQAPGGGASFSPANISTRALGDYIATTDSQGRFVFTTVPAGYYEVFTAAADYIENNTTINVPSSGLDFGITLQKAAEWGGERYSWHKTQTSATGYPSGDPITGAALFSYPDFNTTEIVKLVGADIQVVIPSTVTLQVYSGTNALLQEIALGSKTPGTYYADLTSYNYTLTAGESIYLACRFSDYGAGNNPLACDDGTGNLDKGSFYKADGDSSWTKWSTGSWIIGGYFSKAPPATGAVFTNQTASYFQGDMEKLEYSFVPEGSAASVTWSSSNPNVVSVSDGGIVKMLSYGTSTVTITAQTFTASCNVTVTGELSNLSAVFNEAEKAANVVWNAVAPRDVWTIRWKNNYETEYTHATTTATQFTIPNVIKHATYEIQVLGERLDGGYWGTSLFMLVTPPAPGAERVDISDTEITMRRSTTRQLTAQTYPADVYNYEILWSSNNETVATVTADGLVTAVGSGDAVITAKTRYGNISAKCDVTVEYEMGAISLVSVYQNDAEFSWEGASHDGEFSMELYQDGQLLRHWVQEEKTAYVGLLAPGTEYELKVTSIVPGEEGNSEELSFSTLVATAPFASILVIPVYSADQPVPLRVLNVSSPITSIEWDVDGQAADAPAVTLNAGRHKLTATVTTEGGEVEKIMKYITVE